MPRFHPALFLVLTIGLGCTGEAFETTGGGGEGATGSGASGTGAAGANGGAGNAGTGAAGNQGNQGQGGNGAQNQGGEGTGGSVLGPGDNCKWGDGYTPCKDGYFCDAPEDCKNGICAPIADEVAPGPMTAACGCDGNVYWNEQTAQYHGVPAKKLADTVGCGDDTNSCTDDSQCGEGSCATHCGNAVGQCWMLPPDCPEEPTTGVCGTGCTQTTPLCDAIVDAEPFDHSCSDPDPV